MWLERQALHDPLTQLPNRLLLMDRARQALTRLHRSGGVVALLFIDLDRFKAVNDNLGHDVGDRLLIAVAERLAEMMRDSDTVARLGGDEFVILAEEIDSDGEALALAERVLDALEEPFQLGSAEVSMLASVGVSVSHDPEADPESMLREADVAMYRAKGAGGQRPGAVRRERCAGRSAPTWRSRAGCATRCRATSCVLAYQPILPLAGGTRGRLRGARALDPRGADRAEDRRAAPVDVPAARRGERADRADRRLGAAHRLRAGGRLASRRDSGSRSSSTSPRAS